MIGFSAAFIIDFCYYVLAKEEEKVYILVCKVCSGEKYREMSFAEKEYRGSICTHE